MAEESQREGRLERLGFPLDASLTARILAVNLIPLMLLAGGLFFVDSYRKQLLTERYNLARIEAQITAKALAGASLPQQQALMVQIGQEQHMRVRMYDGAGRLWADSFQLAPPSFQFRNPAKDPWSQDFSRATDRIVNFVVGAPSPPAYREPSASQGANGWPEVIRAREQRRTQVELRRAPDGSPVITAAAPVGSRGATLLTMRNATDITQAVRDARASLLTIIALALIVSIVLSLYLARTIIDPLRRLGRAAVRVRLGREREVEVPRMQERGDEIGVLGGAISDMTSALRQRIDAVEAFAADVAHELKNPLASLRSAVESLPKVQDPALRAQLSDIAAHDVRRIDRLVTEISEASRIDAELSRATFEPLDLADLIANVIRAREDRGLNSGHLIELSHDGPAGVRGVPIRIERVIDNLLDNAVTFSPPDGTVHVRVSRQGDRIVAAFADEGPGIPPDEREKVFARFHSVRPEAEGFGNHSGLGLAIARTIAQAHDGSLTVAERAEGTAGACLVLELPAA